MTKITNDASSERLEAILNSAVDAIVTIDETGIVETVNPAAERLFGYSAAELIGNNVKLLMPEPYRSAHDSYIANYLETSEAKVIGIGREEVGQRKDGSTFPMHLSVGEFAIDGRRYFTGIIHDLTERRQADTTVTRLGRIIEASLNEIYVFDAQTLKFIEVNQGARDNLGYNKDELLKLTPVDLKPDYDRHSFEELIEPLKSGDTAVLRFETFHQRKDGTQYDVEVRLSFHRSEEPPVFVAIIQDVTEKLQNERLLQQVHKMDAIGQLTGGVAHDFNNLLTVVIGNLELLQMRELDAEDAELVGEAQEAAELGAKLTERLLAFARRSPLAPQIVDLNVLVISLTELLHRTLGSHIDLGNALGAGLWPVKADPGQVETAILNLAVNARDAMPDGGKLVIETRNVILDPDYSAFDEELKPGAYVQLSVSDTGTGMSMAAQQQAFEPFFTTKEAGRGTGLGLSMVYGFARQSGGHATIYSEAGQGTTVNLYLPSVDGDVESVDSAKLGRDLPRGAGELVLVVEDNEKVRQLTVTRLKGLGYAVAEAGNANEALAQLEKLSDVDLVFTDIVMPGGMSGFDLSTHLRERQPERKVLLTSGYAEDLVHADRLREQNLRILRKPYRLHELASAVRETLDGP